MADEIAVYMSKAFARFARKARLRDAQLWKTALEANAGKIDADLGGGVVKQRIAREGQGKSGGSRSIVLLKRGTRAVFVFGFEKKDVSNISVTELEAFRELAKVVLGYSEAEIAKRVEDGALLQLDRPEGVE